MMTNMTTTTSTTNDYTVDSIEQVLTLRSLWESYVHDYKLDSYEGTIDNLTWFIKHGKKGNRFRKNFDEASSIAKSIIEYYNENINLSSIYRKTI
jgi:hypothetical protein